MLCTAMRIWCCPSWRVLCWTGSWLGPAVVLVGERSTRCVQCKEASGGFLVLSLNLRDRMEACVDFSCLGRLVLQIIEQMLGKGLFVTLRYSDAGSVLLVRLVLRRFV